MAHSIHDEFYIPLVDLTVDLDQLKKEIFDIVKPVSGDYGLTCLQQEKDHDQINFTKYSGIRVYNPNSRYILATGEDDRDLIYWPKILQGTYIQKLSNIITEYLELTPPRCRLSYANKRDYPTKIGYHNDNHTPYRVHIVLETTSECIWKYKENVDVAEEYVLHQPVSAHPALIKTSEILHDIFVPPGHTRLHIWYQYHNMPDSKLIDNLISKYKLTLNNSLL